MAFCPRLAGGGDADKENERFEGGGKATPTSIAKRTVARGEGRGVDLLNQRRRGEVDSRGGADRAPGSFPSGSRDKPRCTYLSGLYRGNEGTDLLGRHPTPFAAICCAKKEMSLARSFLPTLNSRCLDAIWRPVGGQPGANSGANSVNTH
jgi:hypothetical protein